MSKSKRRPQKPRELSLGDGMRNAWFNSFTGMPCVDAWHLNARQCRKFSEWLLRVADWLEQAGKTKSAKVWRD